MKPTMDRLLSQVWTHSKLETSFITWNPNRICFHLLTCVHMCLFPSLQTLWSEWHCGSVESGWVGVWDSPLILDNFNNVTTRGLKSPYWNYHSSSENESGGKHGKVSMAMAFLLLATILKQKENVFNANYLHGLGWLTTWFIYFRLFQVMILLEPPSTQNYISKLSFLTTFSEDRLYYQHVT